MLFGMLFAMLVVMLAVLSAKNFPIGCHAHHTLNLG